MLFQLVKYHKILVLDVTCEYVCSFMLGWRIWKWGKWEGSVVLPHRKEKIYRSKVKIFTSGSGHSLDPH